MLCLLMVGHLLGFNGSRTKTLLEGPYYPAQRGTRRGGPKHMGYEDQWASLPKWLDINRDPNSVRRRVPNETHQPTNQPANQPTNQSTEHTKVKLVASTTRPTSKHAVSRTTPHTHTKKSRTPWELGGLARNREPNSASLQSVVWSRTGGFVVQEG